MDSSRDITGLPVTYQQIMEWLVEGRTDEEIARLLDIDVLAVPAMVRLAEAKLARLTRPDAPEASGRDHKMEQQ